VPYSLFIYDKQSNLVKVYFGFAADYISFETV
jgi:hypothetical protein